MKVGVDEKMDAPLSLALNLTTQYKKGVGRDPPLHPSLSLSSPVSLRCRQPK